VGWGFAHASLWVTGQGLPARPIRHAWEGAGPLAHDTDQLLARMHVATVHSEARVPVEIQNATSARSQFDVNAANSSLNRSSGIARGTRRGTVGR
jgi:hypothetical protein